MDDHEEDENVSEFVYSEGEDLEIDDIEVRINNKSCQVEHHIHVDYTFLYYCGFQDWITE